MAMTSKDHPRRAYFASFEEAARDFQLPLENMKLAREVVVRVPHGDMYMPTQSRAYIALIDPDGSRMAAAIHSGYAWVRADIAPLVDDIVEHGDGWSAVVFPTNHIRSGGGQRIGNGVEITAPVCDGCFTQLPRTGLCDNCDE